MHVTRTPLGLLSVTDDGDGGGGPPPPPAGPPAPAAPARGPGTDGNKPLAEMNADERADYYERRADRLKGTLRSFGNLTPEELTALREKAGRADALERDSMSDRDKAVAEAKDAARMETVPRVVRAEFRAAAKNVLTKEQLDALLEDRDLAKYADAKGEPDVDKIESLIKRSVTTATPAPRTGPSANGLGNRRPPTAEPGDQGRAMAEKRFGKPITVVTT